MTALAAEESTDKSNLKLQNCQVIVIVISHQTLLSNAWQNCNDLCDNKNVLQKDADQNQGQAGCNHRNKNWEYY